MKQKNTTALPHYRQGDVLIQQIDAIPSDAVPQPDSQTIVLAHGTSTGHHHILTTQSPVQWFKQGEIPATTAKATNLAGEVFVSAYHGGVVTHDEHAEITLPAGNYRITRQREYAPKAIRNVQD